MEEGALVLPVFCALFLIWEEFTCSDFLVIIVIVLCILSPGCGHIAVLALFLAILFFFLTFYKGF